MESPTDESKVKENSSPGEEVVVETEANGTADETNNKSTGPEASKKKKDSSSNVETEKAEAADEKSEEEIDMMNTDEKDTTNTEKTVSEGEAGKEKVASNDPSEGPVVSTSKRTRPPYKYDPEKVTLRFLFANKDGLTVTVECNPSDTVGEVKGQLLSVWPDGKILHIIRMLACSSAP